MSYDDIFRIHDGDKLEYFEKYFSIEISFALERKKKFIRERKFFTLF
jgi:hypothetical protein